MRLVPHAREALHGARDKGYKNVLATNAVREVIVLRLAHVGILSDFDAIIASDDVQALKSEGKHFELGLKIMNGSAPHSFSVGNNPVQDIIPAKRLGLKTILCELGDDLTHYHSQHISKNCAETSVPDYRVHQLSEIIAII